MTTSQAQPKTCIGYIRVSTEEQAKEGFSLEAQRAKIQQWADLHDSQLLAIYQDAGRSGRSMNGRPGLEQALAASTEGTSLVAYSISRLARSTVDLGLIAKRLQTQKAELVSLTESIDTSTPTGAMIFTVLGALAQLESDLLSVRVQMGMAEAKRQGAKFGSPNPKAGGEALKAKWAAFYAGTGPRPRPEKQK